MDTIFIKDKKKFKAKLAALKKGNSKQVHIISDFDRTLTKEVPDAGKSGNSYMLMNACVNNPEFYRKIQDLFRYYYPIEISPSMSQTKKTEHMEEWWKKYWDLAIEYKISRQKLKEGVEKTKAHFREGFDEFLELLLKKNIPLLIFSAGSGDLITMYFEKTGRLTPNIHIVSNFFKFNKAGKAVGYNKPLIHTFSKNEKHMKSDAYRKKIEKRKNVILLGDSLGDVTMAQGLNHTCILKIGFLNVNAEKRMDDFAQNFDMVIINDGSLMPVNKILKQVLFNGKNGHKKEKKKSSKK